MIFGLKLLHIFIFLLITVQLRATSTVPLCMYPYSIFNFRIRILELVNSIFNFGRYKLLAHSLNFQKLFSEKSNVLLTTTTISTFQVFQKMSNGFLNMEEVSGIM